MHTVIYNNDLTYMHNKPARNLREGGDAVEIDR